MLGPLPPDSHLDIELHMLPVIPGLHVRNILSNPHCLLFVEKFGLLRLKYLISKLKFFWYQKTEQRLVCSCNFKQDHELLWFYPFCSLTIVNAIIVIYVYFSQLMVYVFMT